MNISRFAPGRASLSLPAKTTFNYIAASHHKTANKSGVRGKHGVQSTSSNGSKCISAGAKRTKADVGSIVGAMSDVISRQEITSNGHGNRSAGPWAAGGPFTADFSAPAATAAAGLRTVQDRTGQDRAEQDRTGQDRSGQDGEG